LPPDVSFYLLEFCDFIMKKKGVLQLALQLNFWIAKDICNSLYLYTVNANGQVAWVAELQLIVYIMQLIIIQSK